MRRIALAGAAVAMLALGGCAVYGPGYPTYRYYDYGYRYYEPEVYVAPSVSFGAVYYRDRWGRHHRHWR